MAAPVSEDDTLLGKYRVERVLGQGGMGMVVAARHESLGELFAIKLMVVPEEAGGTQAIERFLREARISARLKGEHVAKVHDVGQLDDGRPYMVMEYLEGKDLSAVLERRGALPVIEAAALVLQACDALMEAHALGIVHRDVKPSNMFLIRRPNGKPCLKLLDFGISKRVGAADTKVLTASGAMLGSPLYMSPEQLTDARAVGPQSDIWAIGVVLYELTTGKVPFDGEMLGQIIQGILNNEPEPPSTIRPELPSELDDVVLKCLRKNPADRYASVQQLSAAVRSLLRVNSMISPLSNLLGDREDEALRALSAELAEAPTLEAPAVPKQTKPASPSTPIEAGVASGSSEQTAEPRQTGSAGVGAVSAPSVTPADAASTQSPVSRTMSGGKAPTKKRAFPVWIGVAAASLAVLGGGVYALRGMASGDNATSPASPGVAPEVGQTNAVIVTPTPPATTPSPVVTPAPEVSLAPSSSAPSSSAQKGASAAPPAPSAVSKTPSTGSATTTPPPAATPAPTPAATPTATGKRREGLL